MGPLTTMEKNPEPINVPLTLIWPNINRRAKIKSIESITIVAIFDFPANLLPPVMGPWSGMEKPPAG